MLDTLLNLIYPKATPSKRSQKLAEGGKLNTDSETDLARMFPYYMQYMCVDTAIRKPEKKAEMIAELQTMVDDYSADPTEHFGNGVTGAAMAIEYQKAIDYINEKLEDGGPLNTPADFVQPFRMPPPESNYMEHGGRALSEEHHCDDIEQAIRIEESKRKPDLKRLDALRYFACKEDKPKMERGGTLRRSETNLLDEFTGGDITKETLASAIEFLKSPVYQVNQHINSDDNISSEDIFIGHDLAEAKTQLAEAGQIDEYSQYEQTVVLDKLIPHIDESEAQELLAKTVSMTDEEFDDNSWGIEDIAKMLDWDVFYNEPDEMEFRTIERTNTIEEERSARQEQLEDEIKTFVRSISTLNKNAAYLGTTQYSLYPVLDGFILIRVANHFFNPQYIHLGKEVTWEENQSFSDSLANEYKNIYGYLSINVLADTMFSRREKEFVADYRDRKDDSKFSELVKSITYKADDYDDDTPDYETDIKDEIVFIKEWIEKYHAEGVFDKEEVTLFKAGGQIDYAKVFEARKAIDEKEFPFHEQQRLIGTFLAYPSRKKSVINELKRYVKLYSENPEEKAPFGIGTRAEQAARYQKAIDYIESRTDLKAEGGTVSDSGLAIATEILNQLGGYRRLHAMTDAKNFVYGVGENWLSFRIPYPKTNYIKITLNSMDTYDVEIGRIRGDSYKIVEEIKGVYNDDLVERIEKATGLRFRLERGGHIGFKPLQTKWPKATQAKKYPKNTVLCTAIAIHAPKPKMWETK